MTDSLKRGFSAVSYFIALAISLGGTLWIAAVHLELWQQGRFILGPFVAPAVVMYVFASVVFWALAHWLHSRKEIFVVLAVANAIPFVLLAVMRSQDWTG